MYGKWLLYQKSQGAFIVTSESDSESGSWGNSDCFSLPEKSGGWVSEPVFMGGLAVVRFQCSFIYVTSFHKSHKEFWRC